MDYQQLLELVKARRSIRRFKPDPVADELIDRIIEVARWAPSGANSQPWEFVVVKGREAREKIVDIIRQQTELTRQIELIREEELRHPGTARPWSRPGYADAPVLILLCGDPRLKEAYPLATSLERGDSVFISSQASTFLYMHLAAASLGLGSMWVSATSNTFAERLIKQLLDMPQQLEIYDMMALGYPDQKPGPRRVRDRDKLIHRERYDRARYRSQEEIRDFIVQDRRTRATRS